MDAEIGGIAMGLKQAASDHNVLGGSVVAEPLNPPLPGTVSGIDIDRCAKPPQV